ncbi:MAG: hypothetical protein O7B99_14350 [Planctomycetota bacterium]|nr:hypothetical protein [Planctomycetota bacterium]
MHFGTPARLLRSDFVALVGLLLGLLGAGCASYPDRTEGALHAFSRGHFQEAARKFADDGITDSAFLSGAEAGTAALVAGDWQAALEHLHRAADEVRDLERRALIGTDSLSEELGTWVFNDTARTYRGEGFERVYLHAGLALAYLALGYEEDSRVEIRRSNALLESEEKLYEKEYEAGGLGHFLSAVLYELEGLPDEAYIDYGRMEEKGVGTRIAGRALVRLANQMGWQDDARLWEERYGPDFERPLGAASIVVIGGLGLGPFKSGGTIPIPTSDGIVPISAAVYERRPQQVTALRLRLTGSDVAVRTDLIEDVFAVAAENLEDRLLWMAAKSIARGLLKRELTKKLEDEWDDGGRFLGDVFAFFSERPDLRCWQTLPDNWQACRVFVVPGVHDIVLEALGGERIALGAFELDEGETMVILARTLQGRLYAHALGGEPVGAEEAAAAP